MFHKLNCLLVSFLSRLIEILPVKKFSYLFESHDDFTEGTFIYFNYLKEKYPNRRYVWIIEKKNIVLAKKYMIKKFIFFDYEIDSGMDQLMAKYYNHTTERFVFSHRNIGYQQLRKKQLRLYLGHGQPFKITKNYVNHLYDSLTISSSCFVRDLRMSLYSFDKEKMYLGINPRVIPLISGIDKETTIRYYDSLGICYNSRIIVCLMTWNPHEILSNNGPTCFPFYLSKKELNQLNQSLKNNNEYIVVKTHPMYKIEFLSASFKGYSNILFLSNYELKSKEMSLYELLEISDALITDFSSVFIDYYLTEKPVLFYDVEKAIELNGAELIDNYRNYMAGPIIDNVDDLCNWVSNFNSNDSFKAQRQKQKKLWFSFGDKDILGNIDDILDKKS